MNVVPDAGARQQQGGGVNRHFHLNNTELSHRFIAVPGPQGDLIGGRMNEPPPVFFHGAA
jgi:hypothetical protein